MKKFILLHLYIFTAFIGGFLLASDVIAQSSADCLRQYHERQGSCSAAAKACIDGCPGAQGVDLGPLSECLRSCSKQEDSCNETADAAYDVCIKGGQPPTTSGVLETEALVENTPTKDDLATDAKAKEINDWIINVLGPMDISGVPEDPPEQRTKPMIVRDPITDTKRNYYHFSYDVNDPLIYFSSTYFNRVTITTPDGLTFSPQQDDYLRVPFGTKINVERSLGEQHGAEFWISGIDHHAYLYVKSGEIEIMPPQQVTPSLRKTEVRVRDKDTKMRVEWGGIGRPNIPREIRFEGQSLVELLSQGTDFGFSYDQQSKKIAVEIYDGELIVKVSGKEKILASKYGQPIKRLEIEKDSTPLEKMAVPKSEWRKTHPSLEPRASEPVAAKETKLNFYYFPVALAGLLLLVLAGGFWYRKKKGKLPWEDKIKEFVSKLKNKIK